MGRFRGFLLGSVLLFSSGALQACSSRVQFAPGEIPAPKISSDQEKLEGRQIAGALVSHFPRSTNKSAEAAVLRVANRLVASCDGTSEKWSILVLNNSSFNAGVTKGRYMFVFDGVFHAVESDDELAAVLAHEIGHYLAHHHDKDGLESVASRFVQGAAGLADTSFRTPTYGAYGNNNAQAADAVIGLTSALVALTAQKIFIQPEQHRKELEADMIGLFLMAHAGYNPQKAVDLWTKLSSDPKTRESGFLSDHPAPNERLEKLKELLPQAEMLYQTSPLAQVAK